MKKVKRCKCFECGKEHSIEDIVDYWCRDCTKKVEKPISSGVWAITFIGLVGLVYLTVPEELIMTFLIGMFTGLSLGIWIFTLKEKKKK